MSRASGLVDMVILGLSAPSPANCVILQFQPLYHVLNLTVLILSSFCCSFGLHLLPGL